MLLQNVGFGYQKIAIVLGFRRDKVRNYCIVNSLNVYAKKRLQAKEGKQMEDDCGERECSQLKSRPLVGEESTVQMNTRKNGQRITYRFIDMNVCFAERTL